MGNSNQEPSTNPFSSVFSGSNPKQKQINLAVEMLLETLDKPPNPRMQKSWAVQLADFSSDQLAFGFRAATLACDGFPKIQDVVRPILDAEFLADYSWLLSNLKIHGPKWRDRPAELGEPRRGDSNDQESLYVRDVLSLAVKAPAIPERLREGLYAFGNGDQARGLELLARHPFASGGEIDLREKRQLDEAFRAAWDGVRVRETAK